MKIEYADNINSLEREKEIEVLLALIGIEGPFFISDESYLGDFTDLDQPIFELANIIKEKLGVHFDNDLYLWQIVEEIKKQNPQYFINL